MLTSLLLAAETAKLGAAIGAGIAAVGAGLGIGRIGGQAMDAMGSPAREDRVSFVLL